jgi:hypothetical protein
MSHFDSPFVIILYYRSYSCGKFLSNILSFNKNFIPQIAFNTQTHQWDLRVQNFKNLADDELTELKVTQVMLTIPPSKEECKMWDYRELGCRNFWGFNSPQVSLDNFEYVSDKFFPEVKQLLDSKKYCFIVAHENEVLKKCKTIFTNAKIIELVNDEDVNKVSILLKTSNHNKVAQPKNPTESSSIKFDIGSLFDQDLFFKNIDRLLEAFQIEDKTLDKRVYDYYNQYIGLYT